MKKLWNFISNLKTKYGCCLCGENTSVCLDFHHLRDKLFGIAEARYYSREDLVKELAKCVVVCSCCHRKIHTGLAILDNPQVCILNLEDIPEYEISHRPSKKKNKKKSNKRHCKDCGQESVGRICKECAKNILLQFDKFGHQNP